MDWINGAASAFGGLVGAFSSNRNMKLQARENEKNRQFQREINRENAAFQREMYSRSLADNLAQWNRSNEYNSPLSQMQRLKSAGLNPDLIYSGGAVGNSSDSFSTSPMSGQSASTSQPAPHYDGLQMIQGALAAAQIRKTDAETKNISKSTNILDTESKFIPALRQGQIDVNNMSISLGELQGKLTKQQTELARQSCINIDASTQSLFQSINNAKLQGRLLSAEALEKEFNNSKLEKRFDMECDRFNSEMRKIGADISLTYSQMHQLATLLPYQVGLIQADTANKEMNKDLQYKQLCNEVFKGLSIQINNEKMDFELSQAKKWSDTERYLGACNSTAKLFKTIISLLIPGSK